MIFYHELPELVTRITLIRTNYGNGQINEKFFAVFSIKGNNRSGNASGR